MCFFTKYIKQQIWNAATVIGNMLVPLGWGPRDVPFEGPPEEEEDRVHGNKTEAELRAEAKSKQHVYTHRPKNPYCDVCNRSKMLKHYARKTDGSRHVVAEGFGDHIVADFVLIRRPVEQGIDGQNYMLVIKDIYSLAVSPSKEPFFQGDWDPINTHCIRCINRVDY